MEQYGIIIAFGLILLIAVISRRVFSNRSLGTRKRVIGSVIAVALLTNYFIRSGGLSVTRVALVVVMSVVLLAGILFLHRADHQPDDSAEKNKFSG